MEITLQIDSKVAFHLCALFAGMLLSEKLTDVELLKEQRDMYASNYRKLYRELSIKQRIQLRADIDALSSDKAGEYIDSIIENIKDIKDRLT